MGIDSVEFVMAIEEAFQIAIPDSDAERIATPRQVVDYVLQRLGEAEQRACLEQRGFYRLRRAVTRVFGVTRADVVPGTRWEDILPARQRRHNWRLLQQATGISPWPALSFCWANFAEPIKTVGGTAEYLGSHAPASLHSESGLSREQVEETVRRLMHDQLGITKFEWDQHFVKDLGVD
jgi:acyl carrier protein